MRGGQHPHICGANKQW